MKYIVDTNVLLNNPKVLENYDCVISSHVLREIEELELKRRNDGKLQFEIRRAKRIIDELDFEVFDLKDYKFNLSDELDDDYVDNILLQIAYENNYGMITNDRLLRLKCRQFGIKVENLDDDTSLEMYQGYKFVDMSQEEMAYFYENLDKNLYDLLVNQYIIVRDLNSKTVDRYRWDGKSHVTLNLPSWNDRSKAISPQNDLQACALDLLNNKDIPIKFILGTYGSGKTFLSTKVALHHVLDKGNHSKIMMIRNPIGSGEEIGFLTGDLNDKTDGFFKPIIQHLEQGQEQADRMERIGQLSREIPWHLKGLSIDEAFIIVDEAEDLNSKLIKLVGTRIGTNSVIAFSGDVNQAEDKYQNDNGLIRAVESLKGKEEVGVVVLDMDVRSEASKLFADI